MSKLILEGLSVDGLGEIISKIVEEKIQKIFEKEFQKNDNPIEDYIPRKELLKLFSEGTIWKYQKQGKLKKRTVGGKNFYSKKEVRELFEKYTN